MVGFFVFSSTANAWEPRKPVEIVIPAGQGGGADVMGRFFATIIQTKKKSQRNLLSLLTSRVVPVLSECSI
jgi:tripartite-type tricarboxylate transporter receptor subunit TctC